jgi:hypothetical protein
MVTSWLEHLRRYHRVTNADRVVQDAIRAFGSASEPKVTHFIAASFGSSNELQKPALLQRPVTLDATSRVGMELVPRFIAPLAILAVHY